MMKRSRILAIAAGCLLMASAPALAKDVSLAWNPNSESDLAGYKVYYKTGESSSYNGTGAAQGASPVNVGNITSIKIIGLDDTQTWCFAVSALNTTGAESALSAEVCTAAAPDTGDTGDTDGNNGNDKGDDWAPPGQLKAPKVKRVK